MSAPNDGGPAFPKPGFVSTLEGNTVAVYENKPTHGMSLRDWFAGQALAGIMAHPGCHYDGARPLGCAEWAYQFADAMLAEREKKGAE